MPISSTTSVSVAVGELTGIADNNFANSIKIYPNPNTGEFTMEIQILSGGAGGGLQLKIFNILGQQVAPVLNRSMQRGKNIIEVDMTGHPAGIYNLQLLCANGMVNYKIIIKK